MSVYFAPIYVFLFLTGEYGPLDSETIKIAGDNHNK